MWKRTLTCGVILGAVFMPSFSPLRAQESHIIEITDKGFLPQNIEIAKGDSVVFFNEGSSSHWPASNNHPTHTVYPGSDIRLCGTEDQKEIFDACRGLGTGEKFTFTFPQAGVWKFHDHLHPNLGGEITVKGPKENGKATVNTKSSLTVFERFTAVFLHYWYMLFSNIGKRKLDSLNMMDVSIRESDAEYWMRVFGHELLFDALVDDAPPLESEGILSVKRDGRCHTEAHFLGRMAYKIDGLTLKNESSMDTRCQFGFYHGVIESALSDTGDDSTIREFATQCRQYKYDAMQRFFCQHIIGHGLMLYLNYDLPEAITKCHELLESDTERKICYHGAFMENVFSAIQISAPGHETTWVDPAQPDFPCDSSLLPDFLDVKKQCYVDQSILWSQQPITNFNEQEAFAGCLRAPSELRNMCFGGIGFNMVLLATSLSSDEVIAKCKKAPELEDQRECLVGALFLKNAPGWSSAGFKNKLFCSALNFSNLSQCNSYARRMLSWLFEPEE